MAEGPEKETFFIAQWFGGHFIFDSNAVSCRSSLASDGR